VARPRRPLFNEEMGCAVITPVEQDASPHIELYDSGATRHTSPYKPDFISYAPLSPPVFLNTANQQRFPAVGTGTLTIRVPNLGTESEPALRDALHAPSVAYTPMSLGALDQEGYHANIGSGRLDIVSPEGERVGQIPRTPRRLYKVKHTPESANAAELLSVIELHRRLGHIAVASARKLVESGAVTGIDLDPSSEERDWDIASSHVQLAYPFQRPASAHQHSTLVMRFTPMFRARPPWPRARGVGTSSPSRTTPLVSLPSI